METITLKINGIHCMGCVNRIEKIVSHLEGIETVQVDLDSKSATIQYDHNKIALNEIKEAIEDAGFEVEE